MDDYSKLKWFTLCVYVCVCVYCCCVSVKSTAKKRTPSGGETKQTLNTKRSSSSPSRRLTGRADKYLPGLIINIIIVIKCEDFFFFFRFKEEVVKALGQYEEKEDTLIKEVRFPRQTSPRTLSFTITDYEF